MSFIHILLVCVAALSLAPVLVLFCECVAAWLPVRRSEASGMAASVAVLVPAHNEEQGIAPTVRLLVQGLAPGWRVLIVADNCTDTTASKARAAGAEVIERTNILDRGKGFALAFGIEHLRSIPPEVVIVMDADCQVTAGRLEQLANLALSSGRPVQACYTMRTPTQRSTRDLLSAMAFVVRNVVRPRGLANLGQPCQLMGTGMALPWPLIERMNLATSHLVEDIQMGLQAAELGHPPIWCGDVSVVSILPHGSAAAASQRTRWEHGHLGTMLQAAPRLLFKGIMRMRTSMIVQALDLLVPPLSLLLMTLLVVVVITGLGAALGVGAAPLWIALTTLTMFSLSMVMSWCGFAASILPARALLAVPLYLLWKVPIYARFAIGRQSEWIRAERSTPVRHEDLTMAAEQAGKEPV